MPEAVLTERERACLPWAASYPKSMFDALIEDISRSAGEAEPLAFAVTSAWVEDHFGTLPPPDESVDWLRGLCPDDRIAIGWVPSCSALMAVLHPDGREASEAELAKVLNKETPNA